VAIWGLSMIYALSGPVQHLRSDHLVHRGKGEEHAKTDLH